MLKSILPLLLLASCTVHQHDRMSELLSSPRQAEKLRNLHIVHDALAFPPQPGVQIHIEEISSPLRQSESSFAVHADGLPPHELFLLASYDPLKGSAIVHLEFKVLENGSLEAISDSGNQIMDYTPVLLKDLLKGQPIEVLLVSKEQRTCSRASWTPSPMLFEANGAGYSLHTTHRKGTHFLLKGSGHEPREEILLVEKSGEVTHERIVVADESGDLCVAIEPLILGRLGGEAHISIVRNGAEESRIDYFWGGRLESESKKQSPSHLVALIANHKPSELSNLFPAERESC